MIKDIFIKNYSLIEEAHWSPTEGLNVITGETGAGKSLIMGALRLALGYRIPSGYKASKNEKTIIEAHIQYMDEPLKNKLTDMKIDIDIPLILRREISVKARSRSFINDTPVNLTQLQEVAEMLVDMSEQHESITLGKADYRLQILDDYAQHQKLIQNYKNSFVESNALEIELERLKSNKAQFDREMDFIQFQFDELEKLNYQPGELQEKEAQLELMQHAEEIKSALFQSLHNMEADDSGIRSGLEQSLTLLKRVASHHSSIQSFVDRLESLSIELNDLSQEIEYENDKIDYREEDQQEIEERISEIYHVCKKHHCSDAEELIPLMEKFSLRLSESLDIADKIESLEKNLANAQKKLNEAGEKLRQSRIKNAKQFDNEMKALLPKISLDAARFKIELKPQASWGQRGGDYVEFLFSANKGMPLQPINQNASGGELSRLMLAMKSVLGSRNKIPCLVFDEIDSGISGETATKIGFLMKELSQHNQLLVISHLPQIAAQAHAHFLVEKTEINQSTVSNIRPLVGEERTHVLATIISGKKDSEAALKAAKDLLRI